MATVGSTPSCTAALSATLGDNTAAVPRARAASGAIFCRRPSSTSNTNDSSAASASTLRQPSVSSRLPAVRTAACAGSALAR